MRLPLTPIRFLKRAMDVYGPKVGVVCGNKEFSYEEIALRCGRIAFALDANGIGAGERVAYLSFNNHQLFEAYYGVPMGGCVLMPLNVRLSAHELIAILNHAEAKALFFEFEFAATVEAIRQACPSIQLFVGLGDKSPLADMTYYEFLADGHPDAPEPERYDENAIAELFYTSGSTGTPKGVMLSHRTLYLHAINTHGIYTPGPDMVDLHTIPLFHANGWGHAHTSTMAGAKHVMVRRFDPATVCRLIQENRATHMSLVPTMANALLNFPDLARFDLASMSEIMLGGAASNPDLIRRLEQTFHCLAYSGYGLTETAPVITAAKQKPGVAYGSDDERWRRQSMAGWTVPGVEIRVADLDGNEVMKDSESIGEVLVRGDHLMDGYYGDPEGTAAVMRDGWFHTGDMAVWDEEGYIQIVDRKKEIIISGGENISSLEIERALAGLDDVIECAVVAAPDSTWGEVPAAIVVRRAGSTIDAEAVLAYLEAKLGRFKLPRIIEFRDEPLPKTGTGKVRKMDLREAFWAGKDKRVQG